MSTDEIDEHDSAVQALPHHIWPSGPAPWEVVPQPAWASTAPWNIPAPEPEFVAEPEAEAVAEPVAVAESEPEAAAEPEAVRAVRAGVHIRAE